MEEELRSLKGKEKMCSSPPEEKSLLDLTPLEDLAPPRYSSPSTSTTTPAIAKGKPIEDILKKTKQLEVANARLQERDTYVLEVKDISEWVSKL